MNIADAVLKLNAVKSMLVEVGFALGNASPKVVVYSQVKRQEDEVNGAKNIGQNLRTRNEKRYWLMNRLNEITTRKWRQKSAVRRRKNTLSIFASTIQSPRTNSTRFNTTESEGFDCNTGKSFPCVQTC